MLGRGERRTDRINQRNGYCDRLFANRDERRFSQETLKADENSVYKKRKAADVTQRMVVGATGIEPVTPPV